MELQQEVLKVLKKRNTGPVPELIINDRKYFSDVKNTK